MSVTEEKKTMSSLAEWQEIEVAVAVMAYPAITMRHGEVVCVAGFRCDVLGESDWVRLFPVRVRDVPASIRVRK